jgi:hypothetical protein
MGIPEHLTHTFRPCPGADKEEIGLLRGTSDPRRPGANGPTPALSRAAGDESQRGRVLNIDRQWAACGSVGLAGAYGAQLSPDTPVAGAKPQPPAKRSHQLQLVAPGLERALAHRRPHRRRAADGAARLPARHRHRTDHLPTGRSIPAGAAHHLSTPIDSRHAGQCRSSQASWQAARMVSSRSFN